MIETNASAAHPQPVDQEILPVENPPLFRQLDPRQIKVNRISGLIFFAVVLVGLMIGLLVWLIVDGFTWWWFVAAGGGIIICVLLLWLAFAWPKLEYRHTAWRLDEFGLEIHRGVFWRHQIAVPYARVQHADVSQGPLQRMYELGKLTIHTAGTQNASVELDGISHVRAIELRDEIVRQREAADVV